MSRASRQRSSAFTLLEVLVGLAVVGVVVTLAAPSMRELIVLSRLKSINAELVTAIQYARSEAISRGLGTLEMHFRSSSTMTCYTLLVPGASTNCRCESRAPGSVCLTNAGTEIRTTQIPSSTDVRVLPTGTTILKFDRDGMLLAPLTSFTVETIRVSSGRGRLRTDVNAIGRPSVCTQDGSIQEVPHC